MAVRIRLMRIGKIRNPQYRIVVADSRTKRNGKSIEQIGIYHPKEEPSRIEVKSDRAQYWLSVGAQPSDPVIAILSKTGDWQKFKGLPEPAPLKVAAPRPDRRALYEAASQAAAGLEPADAGAKGKAAKSDTAKDESAKPRKKAAEKPAKVDKAEKTDKAEKAEKPAKAETAAKAEKAKSDEAADPAPQVEEQAVAASDEQQG